MTPPVGGIDPHQDTFTVGIVDRCGVEMVHETFSNSAAGYGEAIDLLDSHAVRQVGVEGSAKWGAHVAIALAAAGFDAREVPASRSAAQRRSRRLEKTDAVDAVASARALLAEPELGPAQALEAYDFKGNRRINSVLHIASVTQQRSQPEAIAYLARKTGEGRTRRESRRAHKRHLANRVIRRMWRDEQTRKQPLALAAWGLSKSDRPAA